MRHSLLSVIGCLLVFAVPAFPDSAPNSHWGYINTQGKFVIEPKLVWAHSFSEGIAWVSAHGSEVNPNKCDAINTHGEVLFSVIANAVEPFHGGLAKVIQSDRDAFIDRSGKFVSDLPVETIQPENLPPFGHVLVNKETLIFQPNEGFSDHQGWSHFSEGLCHITYDDGDKVHEGYMDIDKHIVLQLPKEIQACGDFHDGLAPVSIQVAVGNKKLGFINRAGNVVISPTYDVPRTSLENIQFHDHIALVKCNGICCYIDHAGKYIARFRGSVCREFSDGLAAVGLLVDENGKCVDEMYQP
jgi:hypothetical protein